MFGQLFRPCPSKPYVYVRIWQFAVLLRTYCTSMTSCVNRNFHAARFTFPNNRILSFKLALVKLLSYWVVRTTITLPTYELAA